jgi:hypothetical protein
VGTGANRLRAEIDAALDAKSSAPEDVERLIHLRLKLIEVDSLIATLNMRIARQD